MSVKLKRIKTKEDLKDVLCMIHEDVGAYGFLKNYSDICASLDKVIDLVEKEV